MKESLLKSPIAPAACLALLLVSCAAPLRYTTPVDPMALLPRDAAVYLRLGRAPLDDLAPALLDALGQSVQTSRYLRSMLEKTESAAVALFPAEPETARSRAEGIPRLEAVLLGNYPYRSATFALRQDGQWKKDGRGRALVSPTMGLGISFPGRGLALATSDGGAVPGNADRGTAIEASIEALVDRLLVPGASVVPERLSASSDGDIVVWAPDPFGGLAARLLGKEAAEDFDIPAVGVLLAAKRTGSPGSDGPGAAATSPAGGGKAVYELTIVVLMRNEEDARTFRPAIRLAWYGLSRALMPRGEEGLASLRFELSGDAVTASGLRMKASDILSAISVLARGTR